MQPQSPEIQWTTAAFTIPFLWPRRWRRHCQHKQVKRSVMRARLYANPHRPALPTRFLADVQLMANKMDEVHLRIVSQRKDSCDTEALLNGQTETHLALS